MCKTCEESHCKTACWELLDILFSGDLQCCIYALEHTIELSVRRNSLILSRFRVYIHHEACYTQMQHGCLNMPFHLQDETAW